MSETPRTIQPDDLFRMKFLHGGGLSPDGDHVIYAVSRVDTEADKEYIDLWMVDTNSGTHRQMTGGDYKDMGPEWSPDGKTIAFASTRGEGGKPQIYLLPTDGGEARQLTRLKQGASGPVWSPDGTKIAFTAGPDYGDDDPPDLSKDVYRVTRPVYRFDAIGYLDQAVQDIYLVDANGGDPQRLTDDAANNFDLHWSPDGKSILYSASQRPDTLVAFYPVARMVDLDGNIRDVTGDDERAVIGATLTPDGKRVVYFGSAPGTDIGTKADLWVCDLESGEIQNRTAGLEWHLAGGLSGDMPTGNLRIAKAFVPDNDTAYINVQRGGAVHVYRIALNGDEDHEAVVDGERAAFIQDIADGRILFAATTFNQTPDLYLREPDGTETQITQINAELFAGLKQPEVENLRFKGTDGADVEGWFLRPPEGSAPYPTILYIHGGPHGAYGSCFHFDMQMLAGAGYGVLFINHRASTGYGHEFATMIKGDWGNLDYGDLMAGVDHAIDMELADMNRLGCCGTSGGGNLSCWIVGNTNRFKAAIPQNPVTSWRSFYGTSDVGVWFSVEELGGHPWEIPDVYDRCSPITYAHNCTTPTLMVQSEHDWRCPAEQSEQFYTVLKSVGCTVEMLRQPGGFHGASVNGAINLRREHNEAMLDWFNRYVMEA